MHGEGLHPTGQVALIVLYSFHPLLTYNHPPPPHLFTCTLLPPPPLLHKLRELSHLSTPMEVIGVGGGQDVWTVSGNKELTQNSI